MKIAIVGAGNVGTALGSGWAHFGHSVAFGVKEPSDEKNAAILERAGENSSVKTVADACLSAEVVVITLPYGVVKEVLPTLGDLTGKVIVDCTNPITPDFSGISCAGGSAAEEIASATMSPRVVKAFNTVGFNIMENPNFNGIPATMLVAGDDEDAKKVVLKLASELGFDAQDAGPLLQSRWLESLAWLWISMALKYGHGTNMAFILTKRL